MSNWCVNRVRILGNSSDVAKIKELVRNGDSAFSFDKIIPMPSCLDVGGVPSNAIMASQAYSWAKKNGAEINENASSVFAGYVDVITQPCEVGPKAEAYFHAISETGYFSWYDWRRKFWGTKWDASEPELVGESDPEVAYQFMTASGVPIPVYEALSRMFPNIKIFVSVLLEDKYDWIDGIFENGDLHQAA